MQDDPAAAPDETLPDPNEPPEGDEFDALKGEALDDAVKAAGVKGHSSMSADEKRDALRAIAAGDETVERSDDTIPVSRLLEAPGIVGTRRHILVGALHAASIEQDAELTVEQAQGYVNAFLEREVGA